MLILVQEVIVQSTFFSWEIGKANSSGQGSEGKQLLCRMQEAPEGMKLVSAMLKDPASELGPWAGEGAQTVR